MTDLTSPAPTKTAPPAMGMATPELERMGIYEM